MKTESSIQIDAPCAVVFRFYMQLDHLQYISPKGRFEWCVQAGQMRRLGAEHTVRVQQGRRYLDLLFRTRTLELDRCYEDELLSWPLRGAVHTHVFELLEGGAATRVVETNTWKPPWYLRKLVERRLQDQQRLFDEKLSNAKRLIEAVYRTRGDEAFLDDVVKDTESAGFARILPDPETDDL